MLVMPKTLTMKPRRLQDAQTPTAQAVLPAASPSGWVPRRLRFAGALLAMLALPSCGDSSTSDPTTQVMPTLTAVMPAVGPTSGNVALTLTGSNFATGATVKIAGVAATLTGAGTAMQLSVTLPAQTDAFGRVPVLIQNPDGTSVERADLFSYYATTVDYKAGATVSCGGMLPSAVVSGDWNGDGKTDLAVANQGSKDIVVLTGDGKGGFAAAAPISTGGASPGGLAVLDIDGDQKLDLAFIVNQGTEVSVMKGNGAGGFGVPVRTAAGTATRSIAVGDFNADGKTDIAVANDGKGASVLINTGGALLPAVSYTAGKQANGIVSGDFTGDGKLDLVLSEGGQSKISLLPGLGDGKFGAAVSLTVTAATTQVVTADFSGDGQLDLALLRDTGAVVLLADGKGGFGAAKEYKGLTVPYVLGAQDLNGDGKADLAMADITTYDVQLFPSSGDTFGTPKVLKAGNSPDALAFGDFDGDKRPDVVVANQSSNDLSIILNTSR